MVVRVIFSLLLIFSVLFMPYWVAAALAFLGIIYFSMYWEAVLIMLFSDLLFGTPIYKLGGMTFVSFLGAFFVLIVTEVIKRRLKFYA